MSLLIGSMLHEVDSFSPGAIGIECFERLYVYYGDDIITNLTGLRVGESAFIDVAKKYGKDVKGIFAARDASAGPIVKRETFDYFKEQFFTRIEKLKNECDVEGVLLDMHGAMLAENSDDPEGEIVEGIRRIIGTEIPIGISLDAHAKITRRLVDNVDVIVGYHTIPHIDMYETAEKAAELVVGMLEKRVHPRIAAIGIPTLLAVEGENHEWGPYKDLVGKSREYEAMEGVYSVTYFPGQPWLDYPGNNGSFVVAITDDENKSCKIVKEFSNMCWDRRGDFIAEKYPIDVAVKKALSEEGPVVITELGDAPPAGTIGDGNELLVSLLKAKPDKKCFVTVVDPEAVEAAYKAGEGNEITVMVGHKIDPRWGNSVEVTGKVLLCQEGNFTLTMGHMNSTMGKAAVIQIGCIYLVVCEHTFLHYDPVTYRCMGLEPEEAQIIGVKSTEHFRAFYTELSKDIIMADTDGPSMTAYERFDWKRKGRPIWPLDQFEWKSDDKDVLTRRK